MSGRHQVRTLDVRPSRNRWLTRGAAPDHGGVTHFASYDGIQLAFRTRGTGRPLACLPGGPGLTPDYLGDLGGLAGSRQLVMLEVRGTGASASPADPASYRCDAMVGDVEALRAHLGLERMDLLGHSAAANLAALYAASYPDRLDHLILLTPGLRALGLEPTDEELLAATERRSDEPWYPTAREAILAAVAGVDTTENMRTYLPFYYGRWNDAARAHAVMEFERRVPEVEAGYYADGAFDPPATRAALAGLGVPVLVYAGEVDLAPTPEAAAQAADLFPRGELTVQPEGGHFPWLDDPALFSAAITGFLG
jgi:proline iminopeptidase